MQRRMFETGRVCIGFAVLLVLSVCGTAAYSRQRDSVMSEEYWKMWSPQVQERIDRDIETHRKADAVVTVGRLRRGTKVRVEQVSHDFLFGGNTFLFDDLGSETNNAVYRNTFGTLFNAATVAFYWKYLEPEQGKCRFEAGSSYIYRRPPPDPVVGFLNSRNININGHAIIYGLRQHGHPTWMPEDRKEMERLFARHVRQLADRYGDRVQRWDVVNECFDQANRGMMPDDYVYKTFRWAMDSFPAGVQFNTNECDVHWGPTRRYVEIVRDLTDRGIRIDNVGVQSHIFDPVEARDIAAGNDRYINPQRLYETLDCLSETGKPIHISEVTVCAPDSTRWGEQVQAVIARNLYRLYFSHPSVMGITWWNLVDGGGYPGEPSYSGLYRRDMTPKPAYDVLKDLIDRQWTTTLLLTPDAEGRIRFRGFKGKYRISWTDRHGKDHEESLELH